MDSIRMEAHTWMELLPLTLTKSFQGGIGAPCDVTREDFLVKSAASKRRVELTDKLDSHYCLETLVKSSLHNMVVPF